MVFGALHPQSSRKVFTVIIERHTFLEYLCFNIISVTLRCISISKHHGRIHLPSPFISRHLSSYPIPFKRRVRTTKNNSPSPFRSFSARLGCLSPRCQKIPCILLAPYNAQPRHRRSHKASDQTPGAWPSYTHSL